MTPMGVNCWNVCVCNNGYKNWIHSPLTAAIDTHFHPYIYCILHVVIISLLQTAGLSMGAIIGIAAGGGVVVIIIIVLFLVCCCWYCCKSRTTEEYVVRPYGNVVVRTWDPRTHHDREESLRGGSMRSNGRNSIARSSISSVGSFLRQSIRRLSGKRRSGKRRSNMVADDALTMKVTPL